MKKAVALVVALPFHQVQYSLQYCNRHLYSDRNRRFLVETETTPKTTHRG